jgi:hypothetical protein
MHFVPGVNETILPKVIRHGMIPRKFTQEVSYLRLVASNQLAKGG